MHASSGQWEYHLFQYLVGQFSSFLWISFSSSIGGLFFSGSLSTEIWLLSVSSSIGNWLFLVSSSIGNWLLSVSSSIGSWLVSVSCSTGDWFFSIQWFVIDSGSYPSGHSVEHFW